MPRAEHRVTASALDRIIACPASAVLPQDQREDAASRAGTGMHTYLERAAKVGAEEALAEIEDEDLREACEVIDLEALPVGAQFVQEVAIAYDVETGAVRELGRGLSRKEAYRDVRPTELCGTFDVVGLAEDLLFLGDWKRGFYAPPAPRNWQVRFGALAGCMLWGRDRARVAVIQRVGSRSPSWSVADLDDFDLEAVAVELAKLPGRIAAAAKARDDGTLTVSEGEHCRYCPAYRSCPAKTGLLRHLAAGDGLDELEGWAPLSAAAVARAWERLRPAKALLARVESAIYALVEQHGAIPLGGGRELRQVERRGNEVLDGRIAHAVLTELFGGDIANEASSFTVTKAGIERALRGRVKPVAPHVRKALGLMAEQKGISRRSSTRRVEEVDVEPAKLAERSAS